MKHGIELNGIANIKVLCDIEIGPINVEDPDSVCKTLERIKQQADMLERYMIACCKAMNEGVAPPFWHEVRENPEKYPTNNG